MLAQVTTVEGAVQAFLENVLAAVPRIAGGLVFLAVAAVAIKVVTSVLRTSLDRTGAGGSPVYRQFVVTVVSVFLWFGTLLTVLSIVGLAGIAAALGTATGFGALGVAYALSGMIADVVAGLYLLRDPDFSVGDTVVVDDTEGEVVAIELRKTRFAVGDDMVVRANADIEDEWRTLGAAAD